MAFGVVRHKSPSVGEISEHPATGSFHTKDGAGSALMKEKKRKKRERDEKKEKKERENMSEKKKNSKREKRKREREKGSESKLANSTWTEAALYA